VEAALSGIVLGNDANQDSNETIRIGATGYVLGAVDGIHIDARNSNVRNEGIVIGRQTGVEMNASVGASRLVNSGTIMSDVEGIRSTGAQTLIIENSGLIYGELRSIATFGGATAIITNTGEIVGEIFLDSGNDVYNGVNGRVNGPITCFGGNDTVNAGVDDDRINGMGGNDILNGGRGSDRMEGGAGNDTFYVDNVGDVVIEANEVGADRVFSSVSFAMGAQYIENLTLTGTAAISGIGNGLNNILVGNAAANLLVGAQGNDTLIGGGGLDTFRFNTAANAVSNVDTIADFLVPQDTIQLENAVFAALGVATGVLNPALFVKNAAGVATADSHRIVYDSDDGLLYYDINGVTADGSTLIARLTGNPALTNADFVVI